MFFRFTFDVGTLRAASGLRYEDVFTLRAVSGLRYEDVFTLRAVSGLRYEDVSTQHAASLQGFTLRIRRCSPLFLPSDT